MRHAKKTNHLSRKSPHRKAMLANMACSLLKHKRIRTTLAKAKALKVYVEPLITKSKTDTTHSRRIVFSYLKQKEVITELFGDIASKVSNREGGYTRIIRIGNRIGDNSKICFIELVDYNDVYVKDSAEKKSKRRRPRSKAKPKAQDNVKDNLSQDDLKKIDSDKANPADKPKDSHDEQSIETTTKKLSKTSDSVVADISNNKQGKD